MTKSLPILEMKLAQFQTELCKIPKLIKPWGSIYYIAMISTMPRVIRFKSPRNSDKYVVLQRCAWISFALICLLLCIFAFFPLLFSCIFSCCHITYCHVSHTTTESQEIKNKQTNKDNG